jgi:phytoene synthase
MNTVGSTLRSSLDLEASYRYCAQLTRLAARNFYYAFWLLPAPRRRSLCAIYAFCRRLDDIVDDDPSDSAAQTPLEGRRRLEYMRSLLDADGAADDPLFPALRDTVRRYRIPRAPFEDLIDGMLMDLEGHEYRTFEDLRLYCYRAASTVGLISIEIFGHDAHERPEEIQGPAIDLGIAMQLTNIIRDLKEDLGRGRVYLPREELDRFGVTPAQLAEHQVSSKFRDLMAYQVERTRSYFARSDPIYQRLHRGSRCCPRLLRTMYSEILDCIERAGYDVFKFRPRLSRWRKVWLAGSLWLGSWLGIGTGGHHSSR